MNGTLSFFKFVMGAMISAQLGIWFLMKLMVLRNLLTFLILWGQTNVRIASTCFWFGWNPLYFKRKPRNLTLWEQSSLLSRFTCIPASFRSWKIMLRTLRCSASFCPCHERYCRCMAWVCFLALVRIFQPFATGRCLLLVSCPSEGHSTQKIQVLSQ